MHTKRLPFNQTRRGDIRLILLGVLSAQPRHGYDIIRHLEFKSGGAWRPSPGVVYPTLARLRREGLVAAATEQHKKVYRLTAEGRAEVERITPPGGWESDEAMFRHVAWTRTMVNELAQAYVRLAQTGPPEVIRTVQNEVESIIDRIRKETHHDY